jgi:lipopolysaccharide/colanic/teichoic acid biosynthesis glycosyltransferase
LPRQRASAAIRLIPWPDFLHAGADLNGKPFKVYKFRSMITADAKNHADRSAAWKTRVIPSDRRSRITRRALICASASRSAANLNILRGEMS